MAVKQPREKTKEKRRVVDINRHAALDERQPLDRLETPDVKHARSIVATLHPPGEDSASPFFFSSSSFSFHSLFLSLLPRCSFHARSRNTREPCSFLARAFFLSFSSSVDGEAMG